MREPTGYGPDYYKSESELRAELVAKDDRIADQAAWAIGSAAANEELRREIRTKDARIAELEDHAILATLAKNNEALRKELAEAKEQLHYANGVCDLSMQHRNAAEAALAAANARIAELDAKVKEANRWWDQIKVESAERLARAERAEAECQAMREILKACNYTLSVHGKIDHDTPLHYRIDAALNPSLAGEKP